MSDIPAMTIDVNVNRGYPAQCARCGGVITPAAGHLCGDEIMHFNIESGLLVFETGGNVGLSDGIPGPDGKLDIYGSTVYTDEQKAMLYAFFSGDYDHMTVKEMRELVQGEGDGWQTK